ncbi:MAG: hypothetical protein ACLSAP_03970 [Oscillospiraceae bacterium]
MPSRNRKKTSLRRLKVLLVTVATVLLGICMLAYPGTVAESVKTSLGLCAGVLVPSLFCFMVLATFCTEIFVLDYLSRPFSWFARRVLKLPPCAAGVLLVSMVGGFPVGARSITSLAAQGRLSHSQANRMLCFCTNAGPAFLIGVVGATLFGNARTGALLFAAQVSSSLLLAVLCGLCARRQETAETAGKARLPLTSAFVKSVTDSTTAMLFICAFVVVFGAVLALLKATGAVGALAEMLYRLFGVPYETTQAVLHAVLEVSGGCVSLSGLSGKTAVLLVAFFISFSGICVQCQILSVINSQKLGAGRFFCFRIVHGLLTAGVMSILLSMFPQAAPVFGPTSVGIPVVHSVSVPASVCLLLLCIFFLFSVQDFGEKLKQKKRNS